MFKYKLLLNFYIYKLKPIIGYLIYSFRIKRNKKKKTFFKIIFNLNN
jgi:hypothetical protein